MRRLNLRSRKKMDHVGQRAAELDVFEYTACILGGRGPHERDQVVATKISGSDI